MAHTTILRCSALLALATAGCNAVEPNTSVASTFLPLRVDIGPKPMPAIGRGNIELVVGTGALDTAGSIGETSTVLILVGGLYLAWRNYLNWRIPVSIFATVAAMAKKGMPAERTVTSTWTVLDPPRRATYVSPMGPPGEEMTTAVTFTETADGVAMHLVVGATMDGVVQGAAMGWRSSLGRLEEQLSAHA